MAALVVSAAVVIVIVLAVGGSPSGSNASPPGTGTGTGANGRKTPIAIQDVSVFHLERDADGAATVAKAYDGNPDTAWMTDHYFGPHFAGLRHGLGLAITLPSSGTLSSLTVTSPTVGWSAEVYVADAVPSPPSLAPWGPPVDAKQGIDGSTTFRLHGRHGKAVLLWLTDLGPSYQAAVAELVVR